MFFLRGWIIRVPCDVVLVREGDLAVVDAVGGGVLVGGVEVDPVPPVSLEDAEVKAFGLPWLSNSTILSP